MSRGTAQSFFYRAAANGQSPQTSQARPAPHFVGRLLRGLCPRERLLTQWEVAERSEGRRGSIRSPSPCAFPIQRRGGFHIRPCPAVFIRRFPSPPPDTAAPFPVPRRTPARRARRRSSSSCGAHPADQHSDLGVVDGRNGDKARNARALVGAVQLLARAALAADAVARQRGLLTRAACNDTLHQAAHRGGGLRADDAALHRRLHFLHNSAVSAVIFATT